MAKVWIDYGQSVVLSREGDFMVFELLDVRRHGVTEVLASIGIRPHHFDALLDAYNEEQMTERTDSRT